jgi:ferrochelatase
MHQIIDQKIGILLINLGTPDSPNTSDVRRYLNEFLTDGRVIDIPALPRQLLVRGTISPFRASASGKSYRAIWTDKGSPLKYISQNQALALQSELDAQAPNRYKVVLAMRYQSPSIEAGLMQLRNEQVSRIIILPMFPQYASASTGSAHQRVMEVVSRWQVVPDIKFIQSFYNNDGFIQAFAEIGRSYQPEQYDHILFSYHGIPQRQMRKADDSNHCLQSNNCCHSINSKNQFCYAAQCHATTQALAKALNLSPDQYSLSYQSRLGKDPWMQPYTIKVLEDLAKRGVKKLLVFCPSFVADCLETLFEISVEYQEEFKHFGGEKVQLVESLNTNPAWIKVMANIVTAN